MKTTHKLILGLAAFILIVITILLIMIKANISNIERIEGSGNIVTDVRAMDKFTGINIVGNFDLSIEQSENHSIMIDSDDNLLELITTEVKDDVLTIRFEKFTYINKHIAIRVYVKDLNELNASAGVKVKTSNKLQGIDFKLIARAGAQAVLTLEYDDVFVEALAGSDIQLNGMATNLTVVSNAGAQVKAADFPVKAAHITANAGAQVHVFVTESISGKATSGSQIRYSGSPAHTDLSSSGGALISQ